MREHLPIFGISKLVGAVRSLAEYVRGLPVPVNDVNTGLRPQVALDGTRPSDVPALPHQAPESAESAGSGRRAACGRAGLRKAAGPA
jgi:hypothetical protein